MISNIVATVLSVVSKVAEIASKHPEAVSDLEKLAEAIHKSKNPTEAARRAALAAAAHTLIDEL